MEGTYPTEKLQAIEQSIWVHRLLVPGLTVTAERHLVEIENSNNCRSQPKRGSR